LSFSFIGFSAGRESNAVVDTHGAALPSGERHFDNNVNRIIAIGQRPQQHGQTDPGNDFHMAGIA
jgi:hypothetical protein